jgi:hypothetical protein
MNTDGFRRRGVLPNELGGICPTNLPSYLPTSDRWKKFFVFWFHPLLWSIERRLNEAVSGVSAMTSSDLKRRLEHILEYESSTPLLYVPRLAIAGLAFLMTVVPIAGGYCQQCVSNPRR